MTEEFEEEDHSVSNEDKAKYIGLLTAIKDRCIKRNIPFKEEDDDIDEWGTNLSIELPAGRSSRSFWILDLEDAEWAIAVNFEDYYFISEYNAVASYREKKIFADVVMLDQPNYRMGRHFSKTFGAQDDDDNITSKDSGVISLRNENLYPGCEIRLSSHSLPLKLLVRGRGIQLEISGWPLETNEIAESILRKIADSLFFQIEIERGISLGLRQKRAQEFKSKRGVRKDPPQYSFPRYQYDADSMMLFWYGASANQTPLMQYLAFYQTIEYYYGMYSDLNAKRAIQGIVKAPNFNPDRDSDIAKVVAAVKGNGGKSHGSERSALRATLRECITETEMRQYLRETSEKIEFFSKSKHVKALKINLQPQNQEVVRETADRIYELRCRIVHTKSPDDERYADPLLPNSQEEAHLTLDLDLVRFCARKVLSMSAVPLNLTNRP